MGISTGEQAKPDPLITFLGYGPAQPKVVFLGAEESNGSGGAAGLGARRRLFKQREDLKAACSTLAKEDTAFVDPFARPGNPVQQWNTAARLRLALAGLPWKGDFAPYWRNHLGRYSGDTFLMECYPVPRKGLSTKIKGYSVEQVWQERLRYLHAFATSISPAHVIAYGDDAAHHVSELFPVADWRPVDQTHFASVGKTPSGTVVAQVGFFGQGRFKLEELDVIVAAMSARAGGGWCPLDHPWSPPPSARRRP